MKTYVPVHAWHEHVNNLNVLEVLEVMQVVKRIKGGKIYEHTMACNGSSETWPYFCSMSLWH